TLVITLVKNPDIIATIAQLPTRPLMIGFAAESERLIEHARAKLIRKNLDLVIANNISDASIGFNSDDNAVTLVDHKGETPLAIQSKRVLARELVSRIANRLTSAPK